MTTLQIIILAAAGIIFAGLCAGEKVTKGHVRTALSVAAAAAGAVIFVCLIFFAVPPAWTAAALAVMAAIAII